MTNILVGVLVGIFSSLVATGISILGMWLYNRKRRSDAVANEIEGLKNEVNTLRGRMDNNFENVNNRFDKVSIDREFLFLEVKKLTNKQEGLKKEVENVKRYSGLFLKDLRNASQEQKDKSADDPLYNNIPF